MPENIEQDGREDACRISGRLLVGISCAHALTGMVNGVLLQNLVKPICLYVFRGAINTEVTYAQCNIAPIVYQFPWNLKLLYAIFLESCPLFGSRRYSWICFGWGAALACLFGITLIIDDLVASNNFGAYNALLLCMCFFYMFAEVSVDGLAIELSQYEDAQNRGQLLAFGQMVRFGTTGLALVFCTFALNGQALMPHFPYNDIGDPQLFDFGLDIRQLHELVLGMAAALYCVMVCCLRDPPSLEYTFRWKEVVAAVWETLQSKAMLCLLVFNIGFVSIAGLGNPAAVALASIVLPSPLLLNLSAILSKIMFCVGIFAFRRFFMRSNWKFTCVWTHLLLLLEGLFYLAIIYNVQGVGQTGYFYCFGDAPINLILGMSQVISLLASVEISKCGLEATTYELLTAMHNVALAFNSNIGNALMAAMGLNELNHSSYASAVASGSQDRFNVILRNATLTTMSIQVCGTLVFVNFLPRDGIKCKLWRDDASFHTSRVGVLGLFIASLMFCLTLALSLFAIIPWTSCLNLVGGHGCNF